MADKTPVNFRKPIVKFIVVTIAIGIFFVGGLQLVNQRGERIRHEQTAAQTDKDKKVEKEESSKPSNKAANDQANNNESNLQDNSEVNSENLPVTGTGNLFIHMLALGCLTATMSAYFLSTKK